MCCHECGGPKDDKKIRKMMGCDEPTKRAHVIRIGNEEEELVHTCPRKMMAPAIPYLQAHRWSKNGNLTHKYLPGTLPNKVAEAIDLLDSEQAKRLSQESK